jgi:type IV pilus modification protein PilV
MKTKQLQRGVSLVESLVALVVMSIGMLGIAALYVESVRANRTAVIRTQAVNLTYNMADRIRANRLAGADYALALGAAPPGPVNCNIAATCTQTELASDDLASWVASVRGPAGLPWDGANPPQTAVIYTAAAAPGLPDIYQIIVSWREPNQDPADPDLNYTHNMQLIPVTPT